MRMGLNPFNWVWFPSFAYEKPSPLYPKRKTFALAFLFLQLFLDIDDGTHDLSSLEKLFHQEMDAFDERKVGHKISKASTRNIDVE